MEEAEERAVYLIKQLGKEGALRQVSEEYGNADTDEERKYQEEVETIIKN